MILYWDIKSNDSSSCFWIKFFHDPNKTSCFTIREIQSFWISILNSPLSIFLFSNRHSEKILNTINFANIEHVDSPDFYTREDCFKFMKWVECKMFYSDLRKRILN